MITQIYTLSLHDALPISGGEIPPPEFALAASANSGTASSTIFAPRRDRRKNRRARGDRKSTRLNSSHRTISYAVFCLKKKNIYKTQDLMSLIQSLIYITS